MGYPVAADGEEDGDPAHLCYSVLTKYDLGKISDPWWENIKADLIARYGRIKVTHRKIRHVRSIGGRSPPPYKIVIRGDEAEQAFHEFIECLIRDHEIHPGDIVGCPRPSEQACSKDVNYDIRLECNHVGGFSDVLA